MHSKELKKKHKTCLKMTILFNDHGNLENNNEFGKSGFSAPPGGYRNGNGNYNDIGFDAYFWCSSESNSIDAWHSYLSFSRESIDIIIGYKRCGFSVRCVKD